MLTNLPACKFKVINDLHEWEMNWMSGIYQSENASTVNLSGQ